MIKDEMPLNDDPVTPCSSHGKEVSVKLKAGNFVVYQKEKISTHPSPRAENVFPARHGDTYSYVIKKFWKVLRVFDDDTIEVETRRGKRLTLAPNDHRLRKAGLWQRLFFRDRFF